MTTNQLPAAQLDPVTNATAATTPTAPRYSPRPIPSQVLTELRRTDDSGRELQPFIVSVSGAPIDAAGSPLRCCLRDAQAGERIALVSYAPLRRWAAETGAQPGAYDEAGPVFIHADDCPGPRDSSDGYPHARPGALRTIRRYDCRGFIIGGRLFEIGADPTAGFNAALDETFADPRVALVHVRALEYGCFQFEVRRDG